MKSWIKGGLIGLGIVIILITLLIIIFKINISSEIPMKSIPGLGTAVVITIMFYALIFFLIGALLGWIVGKIKKK